MATRKVGHVVVTYQDAAGGWQTALRGQEIDVHADDLARLEGAGAFDAPYTDESPAPERVPSLGKPAGNASLESWQEYASGQGEDVGGFTRDEIRALFA